MSTNDELLKLFYDAFRMGDDPLGAALVQYRTELTPELAARASENYSIAIQRQDVAGAMAAATVASRIYNFLGLREDAFNALIDSFFVLYMRAETVEAYSNINTAIISILSGNPYGDGSPLTGLRAWNLAADCGFFACEATSDPEIKKHWLKAALQSLVNATRYLVDASSSGLVPEYASTAVAVYRRCLASGWVGEPWAAAPLATITAKLDSAVPGKVNYPGDDSKTANIDAARAEMSAIYNHQAYGGADRQPSHMSGLFGRKSDS